MRLLSFSIENFRSITAAKKIELSQISTFIGKNNEWKSNILNALNIAMKILKNKISRSKYLSRLYSDRAMYDWERDFPVDIKNSKRKIKNTEFRLEFEFTDDESKEFNAYIWKTLNGVLEFKIVCQENWNILFEIIKTWTGTKSWNAEKTKVKILEYIMGKINFVYIPAVRTEQQAIETIENLIARELSLLEDNEEYKEALKIINDMQKTVLDKISQSVEDSLKNFILDIKEVDMFVQENRRRYDFRRWVDILINDGTKTSISYKWDWIKSLVALSILKDHNIWEWVSIIAIEEPESHLHPWAIHSLRNVIYSLTNDNKNQVLISTHNPIFANKDNVTSNIIVDNWRAMPAKSIAEIREILWVQVSDDLIWARYVLIVEWLADKVGLESLLMFFWSDKLKELMLKKIFVIQPLKWAGKLCYKLDLLMAEICKYFVVLDNDNAWIAAIKKALDTQRLRQSDYILFAAWNKWESEFEDIINYNIYKDKIFEKYWINIEDDDFIKSKTKFSKTIVSLFKWKNFDEKMEEDIKSIVSNSIKGNEKRAIKKQDNKIFEKLLEWIENMIK